MADVYINIYDKFSTCTINHNSMRSPAIYPFILAFLFFFLSLTTPLCENHPWMRTGEECLCNPAKRPRVDHRHSTSMRFKVFTTFIFPLLLGGFG